MKKNRTRSWGNRCLFGVWLSGLWAPLAFFADAATAKTKADDSEIIELAVGEQYQISTAPGARFSIGNPEILQIRPLGISAAESALLVRAKRQGFSDLILFEDARERRLRFRVRSKREVAQNRETRDWVSGVPGVEVIPNQGQILIRGEVNRVEDLNLVESLARSRPGKVQGQVQIHPVARKAAEARIRGRLADAALENIKVHGAGSRIWIAGEAASRADAELALALAQEIYAGAYSRVQVPFDGYGALRFRIQILELLKSEFDSVGLAWTSAIPGIISIHQKLMRNNFNLEATLNLLGRSGMAKILSQPMIMLNAQGLAELKVGGEIPITVRTRNQQNVIWKPYGLHLRVEVPSASKEKVRAKLGVEVSSLDATTELEGVPGLRVNRMETVVDLEKGRPFFLSGLIEDRETQAAQGLAGLRNIPVLGALFRSQEFLSRRSELVIAITAHDVHSEVK